MQLKQGFLLIELLVYVMISTTLCMVLMHWVTLNQAQVRKQANHTAASLELHAACDVLVRDLRGATTAIAQMSTALHGSVWNCGKTSIGVACEEGRLIRSQGKFDYRAQSWKQRTKSVLAEHVEQCTIAYDDESKKILTVILRSEHGQRVHSTVALRNREIV